MAKAAIYTRISSDPTRERLGVQRQEETCRQLCQTRRWDVVAVFEDDDRSAYSGKARPSYLAMLDAIEAKTVDAVVAWHPDRLHRSPLELEHFITLVETHGTQVATVQAGTYDLTTPSGRMSARIVGAVARGESEHKSERAKLKHLQMAKAGEWSGGGTRPYGFQADRVTIDRREATVIRDAVARVLAGDTLHAIARDLNERNILTPTGRQWTTGVLSRLLTSARIAGWREHRGVFTAEATWKPIIGLDDLHAVRSVLRNPDRRVNQNSRRYLLTGFLYCSGCGAPMVARPKTDKRKQYVCAGGVNFKGCGKRSCIADPLDDFVTGAVLSYIEGVDLDERVTPLTEVVRDVVDETERRLDELAEMFAAGEIGRREWVTARAALDARLTELRGEETAAVGRRSTLADVANLRDAETEWDDLPIQRQRAVLEAVVDRVVLGPAVAGRNVFDPARVEIVWR